MKIVTTITILLFFLTTELVNGQILKEIKVFYNDNQTIKGESTYRELKNIGDSPFWSKPEKIDIVLYFNPAKGQYPNNEVQVIIEELYQPTRLGSSRNWPSRDKRWVPYKVVFSGNSNFIKANKIVSKDCYYQTAYFIDNIQYTKVGFRIIGIYHEEASKKLERVVKTFYLPID